MSGAEFKETDVRSGPLDESTIGVSALIVDRFRVMRDALQRIEKRATPHPDDSDADRARDLRLCKSIARAALDHIGGDA